MAFTAPKGTLADMHTHSGNSHDSVCSVEDMCLAQIERGTSIMAVTDHFDMHTYDINDSLDSFFKVHENIIALNKKYGDKCLILSGIEIGESFWKPELYSKMMNLIDFDVVIGSIHRLRHKGLDKSFSKIDFAAFDEPSIYDFIDKYFDDVITMIEFTDMDILAHLTYPLRYIVWLCKVEVDVTRLFPKVRKIFEMIIKRDVALEVNTLHFGVMCELNPGAELLRLYHSMGGKLITLGSDAHNVEAASCYFGDAVRILKEIGFEKIYYYKNRKPYPIEI